MATSAGLGYAAQIDPIAGGQTPVVSQTLNLFLIVLFVSLDGSSFLNARVFLRVIQYYQLAQCLLQWY